MYEAALSCIGRDGRLGGIKSATQEKSCYRKVTSCYRMDKNTLLHTSWECKYHIVFAPKYRRQVIYGKIREEKPLSMGGADKKE